MPVGQKPGAADRQAGGVLGERMNRMRVGGVPFEHLGHVLLDDEYVVADPAQRRRRLRPLADADGERGLACRPFGAHGA